MMPNTSVSPAASRNSSRPNCNPFRNCSTTSSMNALGHFPGEAYHHQASNGPRGSRRAASPRSSPRGFREPHPEEAPTGPREAQPDDKLHAVSKDEATGLKNHRLQNMCRTEN